MAKQSSAACHKKPRSLPGELGFVLSAQMKLRSLRFGLIDRRSPSSRREVGRVCRHWPEASKRRQWSRPECTVRRRPSVSVRGRKWKLSY